VALAVDQIELGPFGTNTYVVRASTRASTAAVVDPSGDAATIRLHLASAGATCAAILITHSHFDHLAGLAELAEGTGAPVYAPAGEQIQIEHPERFAPPGFSIRGMTPDVLLAGGETIEAAGLRFTVTAVPGHSPAHVAYHTDDHLFSGDVLFAGSVGRTDLPGASWDTLETSIATLLALYPADTVVCPGHGPLTTLGDELQRNPFLGDLRAAREVG
jgi:hydroxyacylglutathione hydrolase